MSRNIGRTIGCLVIIAGAAYAQYDRPYDAPAAMKRLIGTYVADGDTIVVRERGGWLEAGNSLHAFAPCAAANDSLFVDSVAGVQYRFSTSAPGAFVTRVAIGKDHESGTSFHRTAPTGAGTFRIVPLRPVEELRAVARSAAPPQERGEFLPSDLVEVTTIDPTVRLDIRYATDNNFMGATFYSSPRAFLQRPAAEGLVRAHRWLRTFGLGILIHDGYRPWMVTKMFWDATPADKKEFVADPAKGSRHNRGCAADVSLLDLRTGLPVEMPSGYDEMSDRAAARYAGGTDLQRWHRDLLRRAMEQNGFHVYDGEWWHFDFAEWRRYPIGTRTFEELDR